MNNLLEHLEDGFFMQGAEIECGVEAVVKESTGVVWAVLDDGLDDVLPARHKVGPALVWAG